MFSNLSKQVLFLFLFFAASVLAQNSNSWTKDITLNTFTSIGYSANFNNPTDGKNLYRVFDFDDQSIKLDVFELVLKKDAVDKNSTGFRLDLTAGSSIPKLSQSAGLKVGDIDIQQMYFSYILPFGNGVKLDIGKFSTHLGYEVIEGYDGYNDNYSRSFLFGYAVPFSHTGIKASYSFSDKVNGAVMIVNGWDNAIDNNKAKSIGAQLNVLPIEGLSLFFNGMMGPEKDNNNSDQRTIFDFCGTYTHKEFTFGLNLDFGSEQHSAANNEDASWNGFAGYVKYNFTPKFSLALRGEQFDDKSGFRTGTEQKLTEFTVTPQYKVTDNFSVRADLRFDSSDKEVYVKDSAPVKTQTTLAINCLFIF